MVDDDYDNDEAIMFPSHYIHNNHCQLPPNLFIEIHYLSLALHTKCSVERQH